jgi:peroxiredoxin
MSFTKNLSPVAILLFIPFFAIVFFSFYHLKKARLQAKRTAVHQQVGKPFPALPLFNRQNTTAGQQLLQKETTIIDFWYRNCPQCIAEMQQFPQVLKGKEDKVDIVSVSIDDEATWQKVLAGQFEPLKVISNPVANWRQLRVDFAGATDEPNARQLANVLGVKSYPAFFVLDKNGIIKDVPASAVNYIETSYNKRNEFWVYATSRSAWQSPQTWLMVLLAVFIYQFLYKQVLLVVQKKQAAN